MKIKDKSLKSSHNVITVVAAFVMIGLGSLLHYDKGNRRASGGVLLIDEARYDYKQPAEQKRFKKEARQQFRQCRQERREQQQKMKARIDDQIVCDF